MQARVGQIAGEVGVTARQATYVFKGHVKCSFQNYNCFKKTLNNLSVLYLMKLITCCRFTLELHFHKRLLKSN
jgi:hypothetical protein